MVGKPGIRDRRSHNVKRGTKFQWYCPNRGKWIDCTVTGTNRAWVRYIENHRTGEAFNGEFNFTRRDFNEFTNIKIIQW